MPHFSRKYDEALDFGTECTIWCQKAWHENLMVDHHLGDPVCTRAFLWVDDSLESNSQNTHAKDTIEDDISHSQGSHHYRHLSVMMFRVHHHEQQPPR